ncbi:hypothetical protein [Corallincola spongiicola]|uniref:Uncharacterized protein n=1 Tax=Corallincola spongiicola TaxID=2520508 RepID=A0ABY1WM49_9GAMM|nr:hypothetical protein [Corallincola spongiicola]TAA42656.1 hypothetical protein EXY25_15320 [Corallincola spongiicola]
MNHDGNLVSSLGVKLYVEGFNAIPTSNIKHMENDAFYNTKWEQCKFGCHTPSYRRIGPSSSYDVALNEVEKKSKLLAGLIDGIYTEGFAQPRNIGLGIERTAEGLGLLGEDSFNQVGAENLVVFDGVAALFKKAMETDYASIINPIAQCVSTVVSSYINLIPKEILEKAIRSEALRISGEVNTTFILSAAQLGILSPPNPATLSQAQSLLSGTSGKIIGKRIGVKVTEAVVSIIVYKISVKILKSPDLNRKVKRTFSSLRKAGKGKLATVLLLLLKGNGTLGYAAKSSRKLQQDCPRLWRLMRYDLKGIDMMLFLVSGYLEEYIDRIKLMETDPMMFISLMNALSKSGKTSEIFLPKKI